MRDATLQKEHSYFPSVFTFTNSWQKHEITMETQGKHLQQKMFACIQQVVGWILPQNQGDYQNREGRIKKGADTPLQTLKNQPEITCSELTIETLEQDVKYVQS